MLINMKFLHFWYVCDEKCQHMQISNAMLFSYEISLSQNLYCHDLGTFVWIKKMCKNCVSEEKITNMRSAPFLAMPVFLPTPRRFFNETKFFHIDTEILICLSFKHQHQLSISINISISISASISSSAHLLIVSISISVTSAHQLIYSFGHLLICSSSASASASA